MLHRALSLADDDENATAAYVKLIELRERQNNTIKSAGDRDDGNQEQRKRDDSEDNANAFPVEGICDRCDREVRLDAAISICKYCENIGFCQDCFPFVMTEDTICDPRHSWMVIKPIPIEAYQPGSLNTIWVNNQRIGIDERKRSLTEKWNIEWEDGNES
jgi:hypothetical protein